MSDKRFKTFLSQHHNVFICHSAYVFIFQAVVQMQESLQQQVEQVSSLMEEVQRHHLPASLIQQASQLQV